MINYIRGKSSRKHANDPIMLFYFILSLSGVFEAKTPFRLFVEIMTRTCGQVNSANTRHTFLCAYTVYIDVWI